MNKFQSGHPGFFKILDIRTVFNGQPKLKTGLNPGFDLKKTFLAVTVAIS